MVWKRISVFDTGKGREKRGKERLPIFKKEDMERQKGAVRQ
jgi:hypothetical protein